MLINTTCKPTQNLHKQPSANRLVFIDPQVEDYQSLVAGVLPDTSVVVLDVHRDGIEQISEVLAGQTGVDSVHIVSHGCPGTLNLGNSQLSLSTLDRYIDQLQNWFPKHLLLYGCNVAAGDAGAEFIAKLHQLTGANIAASATKTGNSALGGNWNLEINIGSISNQSLAFTAEVMAVYSSVLSVVLKGTYNTLGNAFGVAVAGKYAYVADEISGLQIIDISDPTKPTLQGTYDTLGNAYGVAVAGKYAYVADDSSGLQIIDISDPTKPTLQRTYNTLGNAYGVAVAGNYAYVANFDSGLQIIDISDPTKPTFRGAYDTSGNAFGVAVAGKYAYVADEISGLQIIDISDPTKPTLQGTYDTSGFALGVAVAGKYAYVADEISGLQIIDISVPTKPTLQRTYDTSGFASGVAVAGNYAYVAVFDSGLQIIDISDPTKPTLQGTYDTSGNAYGVAVAGNYAYVADFDSGLQIIKNNTLPTGTDKTVTINENTLYTFSKTDFGFADTDSLDTLTKIQITQLPTAGQLFLDTDDDDIQDNGEAITINQEITVADSAALKFKPAADASGTNYANFKFKVSDDTEYSAIANNLVFNVNELNETTGTTQITTIIQLINITENIFTVKSNGAKAKLSIKTTTGNSRLVNELGVFAVDDAQGTVDGIALGATGYTEAALKRSKVILSSLANAPNGFNPNDLTNILEFDSGANLRFFLIRNGTTNDVLSGQTSSQVLFSSTTNVNVESSVEEGFSLTWKGASSGDTDLVVKIKETNQDVPLGTGFQGNSQGELIDLREVQTQVKAEFVVNREAAFNNFVGFYQVTDESGGIDTDGDRKADIFVGQAGYAQAAVRGRVSGIDLTVDNQGTASYTGTFQPGSIFAPFIIANGRPDAILDSNTSNDPAVYFAFLGANSGNVDHIRLLGNNTFGFEDLPGGGDKDYNDVIVKVNLSIA